MNSMNRNIGHNITNFNSNMNDNQNIINRMTNWINQSNLIIQMFDNMSLGNNNMNQNIEKNINNDLQTNFSNSDINKINENKGEKPPIYLKDDIIDFSNDNKIQPKEKIIKKFKKKKEKEIVNIYYVYPFSLIHTKKFKIEIYKDMPLNVIAKEIQKRSDERISTSFKIYISFK